MSDGYIHIVGWDKFQHGSTRENPWIKDYIGQLHKDEYLELSAHLRGILHDLRLIYAASHRQVRDNTTTLRRQLGYRVMRRDIERLCNAGFIEVHASIVLAQSRVEESRVEPPLSPLIERAFAMLAEIEKPGYRPGKFTLERFATLAAQNRQADIPVEAERLRDWEVHGTGAKQQTKDGITRFRNWLAKSGAPPAESETEIDYPLLPGISL